MLWIIEDMEFMILWLNCFEGNWNVLSPEENVCLCDSQPRPQGWREKALASAGHVSPRTP